MPSVAGQIAALPAHELTLLTVMSLAQERMTRSRLAELGKVAGARVPKPRHTKNSAPDAAPSPTNVLPILERWRASRWVHLRDDKDWFVPPDIAHWALVAAARSGDLLERAHAALAPRYRTIRADVRYDGRRALYRGDAAELERILTEAQRFSRTSNRAETLLRLLDPRAPGDAARLLPPPLQATFLEAAVDWALAEPAPLCETLWPLIEAQEGAETIPLRAKAIVLWRVLGRAVEAPRDFVDAKDPLAHEARALLALMDGDVDLARRQIAEAWARSTGPTKRRKPKLRSPIEPLLTLVMATGAPEDMAVAKGQLATRRSSDLARGEDPYSSVAALMEGRAFSNPSMYRPSAWPVTLTERLVYAWTAGAKSAASSAATERLERDLRNLGFIWPAEQLAAARERAAAEASSRPTSALVDLREPSEPWAQALDAIEAALLGARSAAATREEDHRLAWTVELYSGGRLSIEPRLQKKKGPGWTHGRPVALRRLAEGIDEPWMTAHDLRVAACIEVQSVGYYGDRSYSFSRRTPLALVGHPHVFWKAKGSSSVEVVRAEPTLRVTRDEHGLAIRLHPRPPDGAAVWCERPDRRRVTVYELTDLPLRLGALVGEELRVPPRGEARVRELLAQVAAVLPVHSDVAVGGGAAEEQPSDPRPVVTLSRLQEGLRARIAVQPLGPEGPRLSAGEGPVEVVAPVGDRPLSARRDLDEERARLRALLSACPTLASATHELQASLPDPADGLEALDELRSLGEQVVLLWPQGRPITLEGERGAEHLRLRLQAKGKEWFAANGALEVDEALVLDLRALLDRLPERRGRFVRLDEDRFVALTRDLLNRLHILRAASDEGDDVRLHPFAAGLVAQWGDAVSGLKLDAQARGRLERVREAAAMDPAIPKTLDVELRAYQREGFTWMSRLAHWGAGACLADDMGLGKTVQALAVLTARANEGPALVVAPTSVCATWVDEAIRFAPALRPHVLSGPTSAEELEALGPFDVVICSYTHLTLNADALASARFASAVLDEAQAIKNPSTQRAKAAFRLQSDFRLITTGTPVENHLHELWSLMRFLNPGLLGTQRTFERRFARPIQQQGDQRALDELRALVRPFVLRRQKRDVLKELPPRTEVVLDVVPSEEERAFSEALRRRALERFESDGRSARESAMTLLAELTRLRQAACHPALVDPDCGIGSAKLDQLVELLGELVDGGHRALVFSQFVTYLEHARRRLDEAGITYRYLDGSTPAKERKAAVDAFQAGEGDAFLISLKAGGTGLTLTGADYVVHLDPWWNPAVEDQASDRAHRIGQRRPVTVYKLVTKGSIEERVLELHGDKRHLAERLFADTDTAKTPDAEALLALLREAERVAP